MRKLAVLAAAQADLQAIVDHIAPDNPAAAAHLVERIYQKFSTLADYPHMGLNRPELGDDLRSLPVDVYVIFYHPDHRRYRDCPRPAWCQGHPGALSTRP